MYVVTPAVLHRRGAARPILPRCTDLEAAKQREQRARRVSVGGTVEAGLSPQDGLIVLGEAQQCGAVSGWSKAMESARL